MILPFRETCFLMIFLIFFVTSFGIGFDEFWHRFWIHFWTPLASNSMFWCDCFCRWMFDLILLCKMVPKMVRGNVWRASLFDPSVRTLLPFTLVRPTSARNHVSQLVSIIWKNVSTLVHLKNGQTGKCAVTVFTIFKKKLNVKKLKLRTPQGMILEQLLHRLKPFWSPFGSIWVVLVLLFAPLWTFDGPFSLSLARCWFLNFWKNFLEHFQQSTLRKYQATWHPHPTVLKGPERNLAARNFNIYIYIYKKKI